MTSRHQLSSIAFKVLLCGQFVHNAAGLILNVLNITRGSVVRLVNSFPLFCFAAKLDDITERGPLVNHVRNLESSAIFLENLSDHR